MALGEEVKKLEGKVDELANTVNVMVKDLKIMGGAVSKIQIIEERQSHDKEFASKLGEKFEELTRVIGTLNDAVTLMNGRAQGVSMTMKTVWGLLGIIITASLISVATTVIELKTEVAVLKSKVIK